MQRKVTRCPFRRIIDPIDRRVSPFVLDHQALDMFGASKTICALAFVAVTAAQMYGGESTGCAAVKCADGSDWLTTFDGCGSERITPTGLPGLGYADGYGGETCGGELELVQSVHSRLSSDSIRQRRELDPRRTGRLCSVQHVAYVKPSPDGVWYADTE